MSLKILILLSYFERPNLVKGFLRSLLVANKYYDNWELAFIDDGSEIPGKPIVERILKDHLHKVKYYNTNMSSKMKKLCGGSFMTKYMNEAITESDADLVIMAGDDDELYADYLKNLNNYFEEHPNTLSCYSGVNVFNPLKEKTCDAKNFYHLDKNWKGQDWFGKPINPAYKIDGTQVAWMISCNRVWGAMFKYPFILNHDAEFFEELYARCGPSEYTGFLSMYKGRHDGQLIRRIQDGSGAFGDKRAVLDKSQDVLFL